MAQKTLYTEAIITSIPSNSAQEKKVLRQQVLALRAMIPSAEITELSRQIAARVMELPEVARASTIFCYLSYRDEVDTHLLVRDWLAMGKSIQVPAFDPQERRYHPCPIQNFDQDLAAGKLGILEPRLRTVVSTPADVAIVPGVVFDPQGHRIGYGKGYYDQMLAAFGGLKIALAFDCQFRPQLPSEAQDVPMDVVITESAFYRRK